MKKFILDNLHYFCYNLQEEPQELSVHRADAAPFPEHIFLDPEVIGTAAAGPAAGQASKQQAAVNGGCPAAYSPGKSPFRPISPDRSQPTPVRSGGSSAAFVDTTDVVKASLINCGILAVAASETTPFQKPVGSGTDLGGVIKNGTESEVSGNAQDGSAQGADIPVADGQVINVESVQSHVDVIESLQSTLDFTVTETGSKTESTGTTTENVDNSAVSVAIELNSADTATDQPPQSDSVPESSGSVDATAGVSDEIGDEEITVVHHTDATLVTDTGAESRGQQETDEATVSEQVYMSADGATVVEEAAAAASEEGGEHEQLQDEEDEEQQQPIMIIVDPSAEEGHGAADEEQVVHEEEASTVQIISVDASGTPSDQSTFVTVQPKENNLAIPVPVDI
jgi:hypothetical protein